MISTQSELQGHESHVSLRPRLEANWSSGSSTELLPLGQAAVLQIKALLGAIQQSKELRRRQGLRGGRTKEPNQQLPGTEKEKLPPPPQRQLTPLTIPGQVAWGGRASSADALITHIKGWRDRRSAGAWQDAQGNLLLRVGRICKAGSAPLGSCTLLLMTLQTSGYPTDADSLPMQVPACKAHVLWGWREPLRHLVPAQR